MTLKFFSPFLDELVYNIPDRLQSMLLNGIFLAIFSFNATTSIAHCFVFIGSQLRKAIVQVVWETDIFPNKAILTSTLRQLSGSTQRAKHMHLS